MVKLVDTRDLKSLGREAVRVRFSLWAPKKNRFKRFFLAQASFDNSIANCLN